METSYEFSFLAKCLRVVRGNVCNTKKLEKFDFVLMTPLTLQPPVPAPAPAPPPPPPGEKSTVVTFSAQFLAVLMSAMQTLLLNHF